MSSSPSRRRPSATLNLGIVAHVDAGKTSLTERLLVEAGVLDAPGSVDAGTTRTDSMDLERRRGITIRAAVTSFAVGDLVVNLLDTPGHPDFIAEVERSLAVLDAVVLVLASVEGVQPQSVIIWRALQRIGVPTVLFVNKVDRPGADVDRVVAEVRRRLTPAVVALARVADEGRPDARVTRVPLNEESVVAAVADTDERLLARWVASGVPPAAEVRRALRDAVRGGALVPLMCGSAITGAGTQELTRVLAEILPRAPRTGGPPAGTVFAVDRDERGRRAWVRMWSGELRVRDRVRVAAGRPHPVTELAVSEPGGLRAGSTAAAGQIAALRGPPLRIGDSFGRTPQRRQHHFAPAALHTLVTPVDPSRRPALFAGLSELADEDPLIDLRIDDNEGEAAVSLHGEVQKQVIAALLKERYGVEARFCDTSVVCLERAVGTGTAVEELGAGGNPYLAGIGLQVEAAPIDHGVEFSPGIERGRLPPSFVAATEDGVRFGLREGLAGWAVTDCVVTMTGSRYIPESVAGDFRHLAPVVVMAALTEARTRVCRPVDRFELDLPDEVFGPVMALLGRLGGSTSDTQVLNDGWRRITGHLPSAAVHDLASRLPDLTSGEGVLVTRLDHHAPVTGGRPPTRRRTRPDPADRASWFRAVPR